MNYISHHGIKGQKWGVRNGPPYPIEDRVLKKGTKLNSVSTILSISAYKNSGRPMYTYRPDDEWDSAIYKGPFSIYKIRCGAKWLVEHQYETVSDLTMPTKKDRISEFKALPIKSLVKDLKKTRDLLIEYHVGTPQQEKEYTELNLDNLKNGTATEKEWKTAYYIFNHSMEAVYRYKSTREYLKQMSKKYGAMVDDNNQGVYNNAHDPIIIFKANRVLQEVKDVKVPSRFLTLEEIKKNYDYVKTELAKEGKNVLL